MKSHIVAKDQNDVVIIDLTIYDWKKFEPSKVFEFIYDLTSDKKLKKIEIDHIPGIYTEKK